jgi:hypothetical protein
MEVTPRLIYGIDFGSGVSAILKEATDANVAEAEPFEIPVSGKIASSGLQELLKASVEISITDKDGKFILSTAEKFSAFSQNIPTVGSTLLGRHLASALSLHVHPVDNLIVDEEGHRNDGLSLADMIGAIRRQKNMPGNNIFVVNVLGIYFIQNVSEEDKKQVEKLNVLGWNLVMTETKTGIDAAKIKEREINDFLNTTACITFVPWTDEGRIEKIMEEINAAVLR